MAVAERIKVLIADDEETVRDVLVVLLASEPSLDLIGVASDTESAIELAARERPDVALVDVQMPGGGGPRAAREILRRSPPTRVIALSAHEDTDTVLRMLRAGALGYVVKTDSTDEILWAIHRSVEGQGSVSDQLAVPVASAVAEQLEALKPTVQRRQVQRQRIRKAIEDRAFHMVFQPVFDLERGEAIGAEALARFSSPPRRGPDAWLAEADAAGLLVELELVLARAALDQLGRLPDDAFLAINVSPDTAVSDGLRDLLEGPDAQRIVLEMTEHAPIDDYDTLREALREPRERGVRLAVDDAGAGFSSLRHVVRLQPDLIKLDVTLTRGIEDDLVRQALAVALVSFAGQIGATVVAEGVETAIQLEALRSAGVGFAQGFYLGEPGPIPRDGIWSRFAGVGPIVNDA
jgi:EAL domain-containing protein (putative c-di-GMP-specific phosphodiesterase class I)/DNA-binding NarL/FixJ family response regulator